GREIPSVELEPLAADAPEVLRVESLSVADPERPGGFRVRDVSLAVRRGEIVGLAGLIGAGRTDFLLALSGAIEGRVTGSGRIAGRDYSPSTPFEARRAGLVLLPEERKSQAIFPELGVGENVTLGALEKVSRLGWIDRSAQRGAAERGIRETG